MGGSVLCGGYADVRNALYAYDRGAEADGEDPKRDPLLSFSNP